MRASEMGRLHQRQAFFSGLPPRLRFNLPLVRLYCNVLSKDRGATEETGSA